MADFLSKAVEAVSSARDYGVVLITGGGAYLADGVFDVVPHMEPSAAGLGVAAVSLGIAKVFDVVRGRQAGGNRSAIHESERREEEIGRKVRALVVYFETMKDVANVRSLRQSLALFDADVLTSGELESIYADMAEEAKSGAPLKGTAAVEGPAPPHGSPETLH